MLSSRRCAKAARGLDHNSGHRASREAAGPRSGPYGTRPYPRVRCADRLPLVGVMIKAAARRPVMTKTDIDANTLIVAFRGDRVHRRDAEIARGLDRRSGHKETGGRGFSRSVLMIGSGQWQMRTRGLAVGVGSKRKPRTATQVRRILSRRHQDTKTRNALSPCLCVSVREIPGPGRGHGGRSDDRGQRIDIPLSGLGPAKASTSSAGRNGGGRSHDQGRAD